MDAELQLRIVPIPASSFMLDLEKLGFSPLGIKVLEVGIAKNRVTTGQIALSLPDNVRNDDRTRESVIFAILQYLLSLGVEVVSGAVPDMKPRGKHSRRRVEDVILVQENPVGKETLSAVVPTNGKAVSFPADGKKSEPHARTGKTGHELSASSAVKPIMAAIERKERPLPKKRTTPDQVTDKDGIPSSVDGRDSRDYHVVDVVTMYHREVARYPLLSVEQESALAKRFREEGDHEAFDLLVKHNLRLVMSIARHFRWSGLPFGDLIQYGNQGLMRAVEKYDHRKGFRFTTYATHWINQSLYRGVEAGAYTIRYPAYFHQKLRELRKAIVAISGDSRELPSPDKVAEKMGIPVWKVKKLLGMLWFGRMSSLDEELPGSKRNGDSFTLGELTADPNAPDPMWIVAAREELARSCAVVEDAVGTIQRAFRSGERKASIFREFYGINESRQKKTLDAVGKLYGVTRERIRQVLSEIWQKQVFAKVGMNDRSFSQLLERIAELEQMTGIGVTFQD